MPTIHYITYLAAKSVVDAYEQQTTADNMPWWLREAVNGKAGTKNVSSRNKPLAQGKPSKRSAKGKPAKAGVKARKGTRKK